MQDTRQLASISAFADLSPQHLRLIASALKQKSYRAGEDVFAQGSPAEGMVILLAGEAVLFRTKADGSQTPLATVTPGQCLNQEALFSDAMQSATLRTAQPSSVYELARADYQRLLAVEPELRSAFGAEKGARRGEINPQFAEQRDDEEILIQTHRHWWSFARRAWLPLLLMLALSFGATLIETPGASLVAIGLSFLLPGLALVHACVEWRNDSVIVTDQRVIRINRTILALYRQVTQVGMESVHEVNFEFPSTDPFARLFRYGTVIVKTAGAQGNLELDFMPDPEQFQKLIIEDRQYFESRQAQRHHKIVREELQRYMGGETDEAEAARADFDEAPRPLPGTNGYLSARILMSNGDIVYRKHVSVWAKHTVLPVIIVLVSVTALLLSTTLVSPDLRIVALPVSFVALLVGCVAYYWMDWDWRNDLYIISDDTITLVRKRPFFLQSLRDQILVERIDNVESVTSGFAAALMKYGDVRMSLVGADELKMFQRVSNPREVQQEISRRQHNRAERRAKVDARQQRQILDEYLGSVNGVGQRAAPAAEADMNDGGIRAAFNADRNRPARLPRKVLAAAKPDRPGSAASIHSASSRRPRRLRADERARDPS